ncbi:MAG TPA: class I SAM-dependent methyltransferase [Kofleriaceae bacterium]
MPTYDQAFWEALWAKTLREHPDKVSQRPPNAHLLAEIDGTAPGRALDAGCGHGAETFWLAAHGWQVTAVDFSASALAAGRSIAEPLGLAERITWAEGDLATWPIAPSAYDLVVCLYVHVAGSVDELVRRLAAGVAPGGTLLVVGHQPIDPASGATTPAAGQTQVSLAAIGALPPDFEIVVAEERRRPAGGVDAVIRARRGSR